MGLPCSQSPPKRLCPADPSIHVMKRAGAAAMVIGAVLILVATYVPVDQPRSQLDSQAVVGNPYLQAAQAVSSVDQVQGYLVPIADLYAGGRHYGQLLGEFQQSTFYLEVLLDAGGYMDEVLAKDYRNATTQAASTVSQIALAYALEAVVGGGPTVIVVQLILDVVTSGTQWTFTGIPQEQTYTAPSMDAAFKDIPGFLADQLWNLYHFVQQNKDFLFWIGVFAVVVGVILVAKPGL